MRPSYFSTEEYIIRMKKPYYVQWQQVRALIPHKVQDGGWVWLRPVWELVIISEGDYKVLYYLDRYKAPSELWDHFMRRYWSYCVEKSTEKLNELHETTAD